jgi:DNA adenine methylase
MKPFKTYFGGKESAGTYQTIINHIRPFEVLYEPFGGNYAISRRIKKTGIKFVNDIDPAVFKKYKKIPGFVFENMDYREFLDTYYKTNGIQKQCIYFDPPYLLSSRKHKKNVYNFEMDEPGHIEFLNYVISKNFNCDVLISCYPNELYSKYLKGWYKVEFESQTRHGKATEWLFMNYDPKTITELHDFYYYGGDFTERQKIKRIMNNNVRKFKEMNPIFRNEYLKRIQDLA